MPNPALLVRPNFGIPDGQRSTPSIFVLMPFSKDLEPIYSTHISRVAKRLALTLGRADDFFTAHAVMTDVWTAIPRAAILVADCTGRNANVFYEIGIAHTVGRPVVLITQNESDVPFDLRHLPLSSMRTRRPAWSSLNWRWGRRSETFSRAKHSCLPVGLRMLRRMRRANDARCT